MSSFPEINVPPEYVEAAQQVDAMTREMKEKGGDLTPAFKALDEAIPQFEEKTGFSIEALIPAQSETGLGAAQKDIKEGKRFWSVYSQSVRDALCDRNGQLYALVRSGVTSGTGAILATIMTTLALPMAALSIIIPITAILLTMGIDTYCKISQEGSNEP